jgi:glycosyltransferase involved in cell wall biosynthesis
MTSFILSIVICSYNRAPFVERNLPALLTQTEKYTGKQRVEVIVVDNNSNDNIEEVTSALKKEYRNVSFTKELSQGLSYARNKGWKKARGEYVAYIDDDAKVHAEWLRTVLQSIKKNNPLLLGGPVFPDFESKPAWWVNQKDFIRLDDYEIGPLPEARAIKGFAGGNMIIKRKVLQEFHGFNPNYGMQGDTVKLGEEVEFAQRIYKKYGNRTFNHPKIAVDHFEPTKKLTIQGYWERSFAAGQSMYTIRRRRGDKNLRCFIVSGILICGGLTLALLGAMPFQRELKPSTGISRFFQGVSMFKHILRYL